MPFEKLDTQVENAGADFFQETNSPDDILRFWRHGDAFPRLVIRPNGSLTGEIKVGNGASAPVSDLPATAIVDPTQLEPGGLTPIDWLGKIHLYDVIANRPAAGPTNEGSLFAASDTSILYLSDGATWHAIAQLSAGSALEILDEGVSLDSAVTSINLVGTLITGTNVGHAVTITVATPTKAQVGLGNVTNDAQVKESTATTKGDLLVRDVSAVTRLGVGANDLPLVGDSSAATGLAYKILPIAGGGTAAATESGAKTNLKVGYATRTYSRTNFR